MKKGIGQGFLGKLDIYGMNAEPGNAVQPDAKCCTAFDMEIVGTVVVEVSGKGLQIFVDGALRKVKLLGQFLAGKISIVGIQKT